MYNICCMGIKQQCFNQLKSLTQARQKADKSNRLFVNLLSRRLSFLKNGLYLLSSKTNIV